MQTGILVIGNKDCSDYMAFSSFMNQLIELWNIPKKDLVFITEDKRNVANFLYNYIKNSEELEYKQYNDVVVDWKENGKLAGLIKNKELMKLTSRNTSPKSISKLVVFLDDEKSPQEIITNDKWNLASLIKEAITEKEFELYYMHTFTNLSIFNQKEIEKIEDPVEKSARLLAEAMKGKVIKETKFDFNKLSSKMMEGVIKENESPEYNLFNELDEEDYENYDSIPF